jgi:hypothetical protein
VVEFRGLLVLELCFRLTKVVSVMLQFWHGLVSRDNVSNLVSEHHHPERFPSRLATVQLADPAVTRYTVQSSRYAHC